MKIQYYIPLLVLIIGCGQSQKIEKVSNAEVQDAMETVEVAADSPKKKEDVDFNKIIIASKTKGLPLLETTNFDSFIDEDDFEEIAFKAFKLDQIYPDFNLKDNHFRAIAMYTIPISDKFNSVVITVLKNENEMETLLINYDSKGEILAHEIASYDEIAEGWSRVVSRISENKLTVHRILWSEIKQIEQEEYILHNNGEIEKINSKSLNESIKDFALVDGVLTDLKLDWVQTKTDLITTREDIENPHETIVVIPEIVDEGEQYFTLNSHIVIADNRAGSAKYKYFESHEKNQWVSDAIALTEIEIETVPYKVAEDKEAFGLNVSYFGSSRANPYSNKTLSLFLKSGNSLTKVLSNYTIENNVGEWNGDCDGEFVGEKKVFKISPEKNNSFFEIAVTNEITYTEQFKNKNDECLVNEKDETKNTVLKFNGKSYIETDIDTNSYSEFKPEKLENVHIDKFDVEHAFRVKEHKIISGNYLPVNGEITTPDTKTDWGDRLLMLNSSNEIVYRSEGIGDAYLYEPHFYKNDSSDKVIIICQMAFEYPFGGEAFILENEKMKYIGTLDIEGYDPNDSGKYMTEIVEIKEGKTGIEFTFKSDKLVLKPGKEDKVIPNNNVRYVYKNNKLSLISNNP